MAACHMMELPCAEGQNVGNFLTNRPSSRVLAAPGGVSQIVFGNHARDVAATKVGSALSLKERRPTGHTAAG